MKLIRFLGSRQGTNPGRYVRPTRCCSSPVVDVKSSAWTLDPFQLGIGQFTAGISGVDSIDRLYK